MKFSHLRRIYINTNLIENKNFTLNQEHKHYITNVLRLKEGESFRVFNENDGEFLAKIQKVQKKALIINISDPLRKPIFSTKLALGLSIIKVDKMSDAISMAVQLGVTEIILLIADRSQLRTVNEDRLLKIIIEAAEQSERITIPKLKSPLSIKEFTNSINSGVIIYASEIEDTQNLINKINVDLDMITLIIGPEGGFSEVEFKILASLKNSYSVNLGVNILRAETAVAAGLAQVQLMRNLKNAKS